MLAEVAFLSALSPAVNTTIAKAIEPRMSVLAPFTCSRPPLQRHQPHFRLTCDNVARRVKVSKTYLRVCQTPSCCLASLSESISPADCRLIKTDLITYCRAAEPSTCKFHSSSASALSLSTFAALTRISI